ncbi:GTPase IMAP family member 8-like [Labrus bergylta]|uniref:GTPase IMAP family member 8-like n=1 Tax=Labrus bergylta TaxID=56723 RepID=UPI0033134A06
MSSVKAPPPYGGKFTIALFEMGDQKAIEDNLLNGVIDNCIMSNNIVMQENNSFRVINTHHFFDEECLQPDQLIIDIMALSHPGPHLFILAIDPDDTQNQKVQARISKLTDTFGENIMSQLVVMLPNAKTFNSLDYLKESNIKLMMLTEDLANDCRKCCNGFPKFTYAYTSYSESVVRRRKAALEQRRNAEHLNHWRSGNNAMSQSRIVSPAPDSLTPGRHIGHAGHDVPEIPNIVLLGLTGTGKSASANTILAAGTTPLDSSQIFKSEPSSMPVTTQCQFREIGLFGTQVRVVDTPDFLNDQLQNCEAHIEQCKRYCKPGCCLVLLVIQLSRFTDKEVGILEKLEEKLCWKIRETAIVLLTHGEDLQGDLLQFIKGRPPLNDIVEMCEYRFHAFNNSKKDTKQVKKLIKKFHYWQHFFPQLANQPQESACQIS